VRAMTSSRPLKRLTVTSESRQREIGIQRLQDGSRLYGKVVRLAPFDQDREELPEELGRALGLLRGAMDYLDYLDPVAFERAHELLDSAGKFTRQEFSKLCHLELEKGRYHQRCPVYLAHDRMGVSPAFIIKQMHCSICKLDPDECGHIRGFEYDGKRCGHVITEAEITEMSVVGIPDEPDARIFSVEMNVDELRDAQGRELRSGASVICNRCQSACKGLSRSFGGH
jgi:hypothetical protein